MEAVARQTIHKRFKLTALTPAGLPNPSLAIAASRAGALGVLDLEYIRDRQAGLNGIQRLAQYARNDFGIKVDGDDIELLAAVTSDLPEHLKVVILTHGDLRNWRKRYRPFVTKVFRSYWRALV